MRIQFLAVVAGLAEKSSGNFTSGWPREAILPPKAPMLIGRSTPAGHARIISGPLLGPGRRLNEVLHAQGR